MVAELLSATETLVPLWLSHLGHCLFRAISGEKERYIYIYMYIYIYIYIYILGYATKKCREGLFLFLKVVNRGLRHRLKSVGGRGRG